MSFLARSLTKALPEPKNNEEQEERRNNWQMMVLGAESLAEAQVTFQVLCTQHSAHLVLLTGLLLLV